MKILTRFTATPLPSLLLLCSLLLACGNEKKNESMQANQFIGSKSDFVNLPRNSAAHWLNVKTILLPKNNHKLNFVLRSVNNKHSHYLPLTAIILPKALSERFPHLAQFDAFQINLTDKDAKQWLKTQLMVIGYDDTQTAQTVSYVQTGEIIDALYTAQANDADEVTDLGATITANEVTFKLWAPTATKLSVLLYQPTESSKSEFTLSANVEMVENTETGVWQATIGSEFIGSFYQYQINTYHPQSKQFERLITTDPYSLSLSINSEYSQVVDLKDIATMPIGWQEHAVPTIKNAEDNILYETHVRDFSANEQQLSAEAYRGKYKAFSEKNSDGIKHLKALKKSGLNNIHLLPSYDFSTVNEQPGKAISLDDNLEKVCLTVPSVSICKHANEQQKKQSLRALLSRYDANTEQAQAVVSEIRQADNFNWGYDPYHYTVPEGSYAVNPNGLARIVEFREMVQSLHQLGFRVIMDVVYNHTFQFGLAKHSVLDKIVPNYYHRLNPLTGIVEQSTCYTCGNTATERTMMAKLMTDSLVIWARDYKIDGFRFDLMGHQPKHAMLKAREAVREVDADTYFYGEGWNFGEVANNQQFVQASQLELGGTEIGTFSDRLRDAVRGFGNNTRASQGLGNGLYLHQNEQQTSENAKADYFQQMDRLRIGLAGNLAEFPLSTDPHVLGKDIPYGDQPTGYAYDPADTINYVSKHDNQTLWDNSQYRLPFSTSTSDRVRMHVQSLSYVMFAQGIPFLHMGAEFMRSKSFLRDSYDYGDWFNAVDFAKQTNNYNVGLPPADKDEANWPLIKKVLSGHKNRDKVSPKDIHLSAEQFKEMLKIRMSTALFRLTTDEQIKAKVRFLNRATKTKPHQLGLLVMEIDDSQGESVDKEIQRVLVFFNMENTPQNFSYADAQHFELHPVHQQSADSTVKQSKVLKNAFIIPPLTTAVFIKNI
ncbi:pullulanase-type alpha-1,6-glucosidase [Colwelliaceae bacterium 6441]